MSLELLDQRGAFIQMYFLQCATCIQKNWRIILNPPLLILIKLTTGATQSRSHSGVTSGVRRVAIQSYVVGTLPGSPRGDPGVTPRLNSPLVDTVGLSLGWVYFILAVRQCLFSWTISYIHGETPESNLSKLQTFCAL